MLSTAAHFPYLLESTCVWGRVHYGGELFKFREHLFRPERSLHQGAIHIEDRRVHMHKRECSLQPVAILIQY